MDKKKNLNIADGQRPEKPIQTHQFDTLHCTRRSPQAYNTLNLNSFSPCQSSAAVSSTLAMNHGLEIIPVVTAAWSSIQEAAVQSQSLSEAMTAGIRLFVVVQVPDNAYFQKCNGRLSRMSAFCGASPAGWIHTAARLEHSVCPWETQQESL